MLRDQRTEILVHSIVTDEISALGGLLLDELDDLEIRLHFLDGFGFLYEGVNVVHYFN